MGDYGHFDVRQKTHKLGLDCERMLQSCLPKFHWVHPVYLTGPVSNLFHHLSYMN